MPRTKGPRKSGYLKGLKITEVSLVKRGANQGAVISLCKTGETDDDIAKRMFSEIVGEYMVTEEMRKLLHDLYKVNDALQSSFSSVIHSADYPDKKKAMKDNLGQFAQMVSSMIDDSKVVKGLEPIAKADVEGGFSFSPEDLVVPEHLTLKQENKMEKGIEFYKALAEMTDIEKCFFDSLDESEQEEVIKAEDMKGRMKEMMMDKMPGGKKKKEMTPKEKQMMMDKEKKKKQMMMDKENMKKDDESFEDFSGNTINKSDVGDTAYAILKSQDATIAALGERLNKSEASLGKEQELRLEKQYADEAEELWPNTPGTPIEKGQVLKTIRELPENLRKSQHAILKAADAAMGRDFEEFGKGGGGSFTKGEDLLENMALDIQKAQPELTHAQAYVKAMNTEEGGRIYDRCREERDA